MRPQVKEITIFEKSDNFDVYFEFNDKIVNMLKSIGNASFKEKPKKHWNLPNNKRTPLIHLFRSKGYYIHFRQQFPDEPDVVSVLGHCKVCHELKYVNKDSVCVQCSFKN